MTKNISQHAVIRYVQMSVKVNFPEHNEVLEIKSAKTQYHSRYRFPFIVVEYYAGEQWIK